jgi:hypothetical protein
MDQWFVWSTKSGTSVFKDWFKIGISPVKDEGGRCSENCL